jgi:hypothetical protein
MIPEFLTLDIRWGNWITVVDDGREAILQQQQGAAIRIGWRVVNGHVCIHQECWVCEQRTKVKIFLLNTYKFVQWRIRATVI